MLFVLVLRGDRSVRQAKCPRHCRDRSGRGPGTGSRRFLDVWKKRLSRVPEPGNGRAGGPPAARASDLRISARKRPSSTARSLPEGFENLLERISYIDFLAATMERVPKVIPHEGGTRLGEAVWHVLTPRILFPDKPEPPSDTQVTAYYTNLPNAVFASANTSISIGYLGELYIDFGVAGALLAVFLMGLIFGRCYRAIRIIPARRPLSTMAYA